MNKTVKIVGGVVAGVIVLGGIGAALGEGDTPTQDTVTTTPSTTPVPLSTLEPVEPAQQPTPELEVADDPAVEPGDQPSHVQLLALQMSWDDLTAAERDSICQMGYMTGFDVVANEFLAIGESDDQFSFSVVRDFFYDACNS